MENSGIQSASATSVLRTRLITAAWLVGSLIALLAFAAASCAGMWTLFAVGSMLIVLCVAEAAVLQGKRRSMLHVIACALIIATPLIAAVQSIVAAALTNEFSACVYGLPAMFLSQVHLAEMLAVGWALIYTFWFTEKNIDFVAAEFGTLILAVLLVGGGGTALLATLWSPHGLSKLIYIVAVVCLNDSAALFVGKKVGGIKFAPSISPGKTVAGSCAGLVVGILAGASASSLVGVASWSWNSVFLGLIITVVAQLGDLTKSLMKRRADVKDSGSILPGHGGALDRLDGILAAALAGAFLF